MKIVRTNPTITFGRCAWALLFFLLVHCPSILAQETNSPAKNESNAPARPETNAPARLETNSPAGQETNAPAVPEMISPAEDDTSDPASPETNAVTQPVTNGLAPRDISSPIGPATNAITRLDYPSFKIINDRNIFNPNRSPRLARSGRSGASPPKPVKIESFSLVGTMSSEKGRLAFFDSSSAQYKKALRPDGTIAGYTVRDITTQLVKLEAGGKVTELRVGMQMRRQDEGEWEAVAHSGTYAKVIPSTAASANAETNSSAAEDEVLKKLMQKHEQENK